MSIIDEAGILAISTRLQRLSEAIRKDGKQIYSHFGIDFEPKWFPVVYALYQKKSLSVLEIASEIGYTHPSTISLLKELEKKKLIRSKKDRIDERKRLIQLTAKGIEIIEKMKPVWKIMSAAISELTATENNLMQAIAEVETNLQKRSFLERALKINSGSDVKNID